LHTGKNDETCKLKFQVTDTGDKLRLNFNSGQVNVNPVKFLRFIEKVPEVDYQIEK